jgi:hypothetical protein
MSGLFSRQSGKSGLALCDSSHVKISPQAAWYAGPGMH